MKYFLWGFLKKLDITHLITFSLGVIVICFLDALVFEKSIADWVIAVANVCMAGAALYAAYQARKWIVTQKKSYAVKRTDDFLNNLAALYVSLAKLIYYIDRIKNRKTHNREINRIGKELKISFDEYLNHMDSIHAHIALMPVWSIKFKNENTFDLALQETANGKSSTFIRTLLIYINHNLSNVENAEMVKYIDDNIEIALSGFTKASYNFSKLLNSKYDDFFMHE
ncbi:hypothetical protein [Pectobacterium versatile]|uniref:hypothetical protein n=1 Tax=Pectobacterium versatile TaxID=2488639 RepID=UPI001F45CF7C|nr:hypothetical protein [Pectobacterium versatile]